MKYCLLDIAYDDSFHGFQIQPRVRTVQGEILKSLKPLKVEKVFVSSRTDSRVRASSNIIELQYDDCLKICRMVDSIEGIVVRKYMESDNFVKLRGKVTKRYLYLNMGKLSLRSVRKAIKEVMSSDYSNLSRDPKKKVLLESITFKNSPSYSAFFFQGKSFSWNFVRITAECIIKRSQGKISDDEWNDVLDGRRKYRYKGKPENLILLSTEFSDKMTEFDSRNIRKFEEKLIKELLWIDGVREGIANGWMPK